MGRCVMRRRGEATWQQLFVCLPQFRSMLASATSPVKPVATTATKAAKQLMPVEKCGPAVIVDFEDLVDPAKDLSHSIQVSHQNIQFHHKILILHVCHFSWYRKHLAITRMHWVSSWSVISLDMLPSAVVCS